LLYEKKIMENDLDFTQEQRNDMRAILRSDSKTSSWIKTPEPIHNHGCAGKMFHVKTLRVKMAAPLRRFTLRFLPFAKQTS
jgi:hypothetical protein